MIKRLIILLALMLWAAPGWAAVTFVNHCEYNFAQNGGTSASDCDMTGANLLVLAIAYYSTGNPAISSSPANTWNARTEYASTNSRIKIHYAYNASVSSTMTFTASGSDQYSSIAVLGFAGALATDPYDVENGATDAGFVTTLQPGSITPGQNDEVVVTALCFEITANTASIDSGFSTAYQKDVITGTAEGVAIAYKIQTAAAAVNPAWSLTVASPMNVTQASFKSAGGGGGANSSYYRQQLQRVLR